MSLDTEAQNDEILAISCIYDDSFFQGSHETEESERETLGGELRLHIKLPKPFNISKKCKSSAVDLTLQVEFLPPLVLNFYFPPTYPSSNMPHFTLSCKWLSKYQLSELCKELDNLWEATIGNVVMFTWAQFLTEETMSFLKLEHLLELPNCSSRLRTKTNSFSESNIDPKNGTGGDQIINSPSETNLETREETSEHNIKSNLYKSDIPNACRSEVSNGYMKGTLDDRGIQDFSPELNLFSFLREYNEEQKIKKFNSRRYECLICYSEKSGPNCLEFYPCCHVFCNSCCKSFFEVQITEGNIQLLKCPTEKCNSDAYPKQVESLVSPELYEKWDKMLLNSTLSAMDDIQRCPRIHCQYPVTIEDKTGHCPSCNFVFCSLCRFGYHALEKCRFLTNEVEDIVKMYQNGNASEQQRLIFKYGKQRINSLVQEFMSTAYISEKFQKCPKCKANIEKIDGCNKMSCNRCSTTFCWLCSKVIPSSNPYSHFSNPDSPCYDQLFQGAEPDIDWIEYDVYDDYDDDDDMPQLD